MKRYLLPLALTLLLFTAACSYKVATVSKQSSDTAMISIGSSQDDTLITTPAEVELTLNGPHCHPGTPVNYHCGNINCPCCFTCIFPNPEPWGRIVWPPEQRWEFVDLFCGLSNLYFIAPQDQLSNQPWVKYYTFSERLEKNLNTWHQVGVDYQPIIAAYYGMKGYIYKNN